MRRGYFDLVVKVYPKGNISKFLGDMKEGDTIEAKGPIPKLDYQPNKWKSIGMIAGAYMRTRRCFVLHTRASSWHMRRINSSVL